MSDDRPVPQHACPAALSGVAVRKSRSDEVIDRRLEFLWQRVESAYRAYYHIHHKTPREHAASDVLDNALLAYRLSASRYGQNAPSVRNDLRKIAILSGEPGARFLIRERDRT